MTLLENLDIGALRGVFRCYMRRLGNHRPIRFSYYGFEVAELKGHSREAMIICDLCGQAKECRPKEIEGKEYDICSECWTPLAEKLKAKGRAKKSRETVFLPPPAREREDEERKPLPGEPPKIWGSAGRPN